MATFYATANKAVEAYCRRVGVEYDPSREALARRVERLAGAGILSSHHREWVLTKRALPEHEREKVVE